MSSRMYYPRSYFLLRSYTCAYTRAYAFPYFARLSCISFRVVSRFSLRRCSDLLSLSLSLFLAPRTPIDLVALSRSASRMLSSFFSRPRHGAHGCLCTALRRPRRPSLSFRRIPLFRIQLYSLRARVRGRARHIQFSSSITLYIYSSYIVYASPHAVGAHARIHSFSLSLFFLSHSLILAFTFASHVLYICFDLCFLGMHAPYFSLSPFFMELIAMLPRFQYAATVFPAKLYARFPGIYISSRANLSFLHSFYARCPCS